MNSLRFRGRPSKNLKPWTGGFDLGAHCIFAVIEIAAAGMAEIALDTHTDARRAHIENKKYRQLQLIV